MSAKEQTDTPRTEAMINSLMREYDHSDAVDNNETREQFARQLETELTALQADVRRLVGELLKDPAYGFLMRPARDEFKQFLANNPTLKPENDQAE